MILLFLLFCNTIFLNYSSYSAIKYNRIIGKMNVNLQITSVICWENKWVLDGIVITLQINTIISVYFINTSENNSQLKFADVWVWLSCLILIINIAEKCLTFVIFYLYTLLGFCYFLAGFCFKFSHASILYCFVGSFSILLFLSLTGISLVS